MDTSQARILDYCLKNCIFDGWTRDLLEKACLKAGLEANYWKIIFPRGAIDVIRYFTSESDVAMAVGFNPQNLRTHEKIRELIKIRLEQNNKLKEQIKTCLPVYALHPVDAVKATYDTVDAIWRLAGDTSTDWNHYSKRMLLAGVYGSTLTYWLNDKSEGSQDSWEFLDRRLAEVGKFNQFMKTAKSKLKPAS